MHLMDARFSKSNVVNFVCFLGYFVVNFIYTVIFALSPQDDGEKRQYEKGRKESSWIDVLCRIWARIPLRYSPRRLKR